MVCPEAWKMHVLLLFSEMCTYLSSSLPIGLFRSSVVFKNWSLTNVITIIESGVWKCLPVTMLMSIFLLMLLLVLITIDTYQGRRSIIIEFHSLPFETVLV